MQGNSRMKNILVPVELHSSLESVFQTTVLLARRFASGVEGVALGPDLPDLVAFDMPVSWTVSDQNTWKELAEESQKKFEAAMTASGLPAAGAGPGWRWAGDKSLGDSQMASYGRVFDITVVGRPGSERGDPRMATAEAAIFESGRPILLAPPEPPKSMGETIVISWNRSTETARCVGFAMPLLLQAKKVYVLTIEGFMVDGPTGEQCAQMLAAHGIDVEAVTRPNRKTHGESALEETAELGGDLLVKGAFTQSRLRQMIFGGPTAHILSKAKLPVFMAN